MRYTRQGDVLKIENISAPVLVVSKNFFNQSEQIIACPILKKATPAALHISIETKDVTGYVLCEQLKLFDLRTRGYKKLSELKYEDVINITDAVQGIFDYI